MKRITRINAALSQEQKDNPELVTSKLFHTPHNVLATNQWRQIDVKMSGFCIS